MDRDKRWERIDRAFAVMVAGGGTRFADPVEAMQRSYEKGVTDEFVEPVTIVDAHNEPVGLIRDDDACIFFNYRADRGREMTEALTKSGKNLFMTTMTQYDKTFTVPFVLTKEPLDNILANVFAGLNWKNLRVAETEKYAHVTYFFNGGIEIPFPGEDRTLIPSLKVATYDLAPEMRAEAIGDTIVKAINDTAFDLVVANFANADMVGHSGKLEPTIKACEAVDAQLGRIYKAIKERNGNWLITADHGNAELMVDPVSGGPHTAHTTNPVPFIYVGEEAPHYRLRTDGSLRDISPTLLNLLKLGLPREMTGGDLRVPITK
jgi:2,3-bisphosphoglycerate-independent phosphoglycerate mutase